MFMYYTDTHKGKKKKTFKVSFVCIVKKKKKTFALSKTFFLLVRAVQLKVLIIFETSSFNILW